MVLCIKSEIKRAKLIISRLYDGGRQSLVTICVKDDEYWTRLETCFGRIIVPMLGLLLDYS